METDFDIAIVGAGAAGIGAARVLAGSGLDVIVIEALPRLGGRAWTHRAGGLPLDLGCGWFHSADRNPWVPIARANGLTIDRRHHAWMTQYRDLGFPPEEQEAAHGAFEALVARMESAGGGTDRAADLVDPEDRWRPYLDALSGFINGDTLAGISIADYLAYDRAAHDVNWRVESGLGALVASAMPDGVRVGTSTMLADLTLERGGVVVVTNRGAIRARAVIVTVSSDVLAGDTIRWPTALDPWRQAAGRLPLGRNEKLFLAIDGDAPFENETHVLGDPNDVASGSYYIRPFGWPVIECYLGGESARLAEALGAQAAFARAVDEIARLFGASVRVRLRPLAASDWASMPTIGGAYSHALPGHHAVRQALAEPFDDRVFFAGEATHSTDFSTAHGALASGIRAGKEALAALS